MEKLLAFLKENDSWGRKVTLAMPTPEPKLTHVKVRNIDQDIARNLALYGNPLGNPVKTQPNRKPGTSYEKSWIEK